MVVKKQSAKTAQLYAYSFDRETWQGDLKHQGIPSSIHRDCKAVHASLKIRNSIGYLKD